MSSKEMGLGFSSAHGFRATAHHGRDGMVAAFLHF